MPTNAIDQTIETLFENRAHKYVGVPVQPKVFKSEARKRIKRSLDTLDAKTRKRWQKDIAYRLEQFDEFDMLSERRRREVVDLARKKGILVEEAYKLSK